MEINGQHSVGLWDEDAAAAYLSTTPRHLRRLTSEHGLAFVRVGVKRRFRREDLDEYIARATVRPELVASA